MSVVAQSYRPIELIVVDDASEPSTGRIIEETAAGSVQLSVLESYRAGPAAARNAGLAASSGDYIQFLDDDDQLFPDKILSQLPPLEGGVADVVFGDWVQGVDLSSSRRERRTTWDSHFAYLVGVSWVSNFAYLSRRECCLEIRGWDAELRFNDDFDFFLRLAASGARFRHVPCDTGFYRWHPNARVSREQQNRKTEITSFIVRRATEQVVARRALSMEEKNALVAVWRRLALELIDQPKRFADVYAELENCRADIGSPVPSIERLLSPWMAFQLYHLGRPLYWARRMLHALLPLKARHFVRRVQQRVIPIK